MRHHLAPRDVYETKAPLAAARDKKITSTRAEGGERESARGSRRDLTLVSQEGRRTCLCLYEL